MTVKRKLTIATGISLFLIQCVWILSAYAFDMSFNMGFGQSAKSSQYVDITSSLSWSPTSKDFGNVNTGSTADQVFTITGVEAEEISLSVTGSAFSEVSRTCAANPFDLLTGNCTVTVRYTAGTGAQTGSLVAAWTNQTNVTAALSGTGVNLDPPTTPVISVTPGDTQNVIALTSGGTGATSYDLLWGLSTGSHPNTITGATLPYTHTGRTNGTPYYYVLNAINANGATASSEVSGTPNVTGYSDSFTGTDGTLLATHDSNWSTLDSTICPVIGYATISGNKLVGDSAWHAAGGRYTASTSGISQATITAVSSGATVSKIVAVRANGTSSGYYAKLVTPSGGNWTTVGLYKNGSFLASATGQTISQTVDHVLRITASGANPVSLEVFVDGVSKVTYSDSSSPIASGNPGLCAGAAGTLSNNYMDDWQDY